MKNIDATTAKFDFKKTTVTVFSKQPVGQDKYGDGEGALWSTMQCGTVILTGIFTSILGD